MFSSIRAKNRLALAFATVLGDMLLQAGDGHGHSNRQLPLLGSRQAPKPNQAAHPVARLDELAFEPSMFRTTYRQGREQTHRAPVENRERQSSIKANKKQTLFSPYIRLQGMAIAKTKPSTQTNPSLVRLHMAIGTRTNSFCVTVEAPARLPP
jgi:hypothetical protein